MKSGIEIASPQIDGEQQAARSVGERKVDVPDIHAAALYYRMVIAAKRESQEREQGHELS